MNDQELIARLRAWDGSPFDDDAHEDADRIAQLVKERDDYKDLYYAGFKDAASLNIHYAEIGYKAKTAEAKLTKAIGALRECQEALRDHMKQYPHMVKGYTVDAEKNARAVLAELEGKG